MIYEKNHIQFNRFIHKKLRNCKPSKTIIIDLGQVRYINSTGIAVLFSVFHFQEERKKKVAISGMHPLLNQVFDIIEIPNHVLVFDDLPTAKKALHFTH